MNSHPESDDALRFQCLVQATSQIIWRADAAGNAIDSPSWREFTGSETGPIQGQDWLEAVHPEDRELAIRAWSNAIANRTTYETAYRLRRHDGQYRHVLARGVPIATPDGTVKEWIGACTDITDFKRTQAEVETSRSHTQNLLDTTLDGVHVIDDEGNLVEASPSFYRMLGYPADPGLKLHVSDWDESWKGKSFSNRPLDLATAPGIFERRHRRRDGTLIDVEISARARELNGRMYIYASSRDITQRKRDMETLQRSARLNQALRQSITEIGNFPDLHSALACLLRKVIEQTSMDSGGVYLIEGEEAVLQHHRGLAAEFVEQVARRPLDTPYMQFALGHAGELVDVAALFPEQSQLGASQGIFHVYCCALRSGTQAVGFLVVSSRAPQAPAPLDLEFVRILTTETSFTFGRLATEERLRSVLSTMTEGLVVQGSDGEILECNHRAETILGLTRDQMLGRTSVDPRWRAVRENGTPFPGDEHPAMVSLRTGAPCHNVVMGVHLPDGSLRWININSEPAVKPGRLRPHAVVTSFADITERKHADERTGEFLSLLESTLESTADGILVADARGRMLRFNQRFAEMWRLPPEITKSGNDEEALRFVLEQLQAPDNFLQKVRDLYEDPRAVSFDVLDFKDGRVFERYSQPRWRGDTPVGRVWSFRDITDRSRAEAALRESEANFRTFFDTLADLIWVQSMEGTLLCANLSLGERLAYNLRELTGMQFLNLFERDRRDEAREAFESVLRSEREASLVPLCTARGEPVSVSTKVWPGRWNGANCIFALSRDLTEEQEANQCFESLFRSSPAIMAISSIDGVFIDVNNAFLKVLGYTREEVIGRRSTELTLFPNTTQHALASNQLRTAGRLTDFALEVRRKDLGILHGLFSGERIRLGGRDYFLTVMIDVSERHQAELALRDRNALLANVIDGTGVGIWRWNIQTGEATFDERWASMIGYTLEELQPMGIETWERLTHPDDLKKSEAELERHFAGETVRYDCECRMRHKNGSWVWVHDRGKVCEWSKDGKPLIATGTHADITERRHAQLRLEESEAQLRRLGDNLPGGMIYQLCGGSNGKRQFVYVSAGVERITGLTAESVRREASLLYSQIIEEDRPLLAQREAECLRTLRPFSAEARIRRADGEMRWIYLHSAPTSLPDGRMLWDGLLLDITERKQLEERLRQSQKMEGIGHLAGGMAHEFNNILAAMMLGMDLMRMLTTEPGVQGQLDELEALAKRAADLIKQLLAFGRKSLIHREVLDLAEVVEAQRRILGRLLGERISIEFSADELPHHVYADRSALEQVLMNLCLNARDAMPEGGRLKLEVRAQDLGPTGSKEHPDAPPGNYVSLAVTDTGCGMQPETLKHLFEPFFTTKEIGKGTGLGLATTRGIVEQHRGWVDVESAPGRGSTFRVFLPATTRAVSPQKPSHNPILVHGNGTILVVEDEPEVRKLAVLHLSQNGYQVHEAANGTEALAVWRAHAPKIDLLYTDMVMPGELTGLQLAERILAEKPETKVIITSGYNNALPELGKLWGTSMVYLPKPCPPATLLSVLQECLKPK